ncbi:hypothetical protein [Oceanibaculum nanhaiense]|uniref:hypothetical protein n=1 Tax=Oceanibaculum nanhaiense TaxID=1909734 RepID=UPI00396E7E39
MGGNGLTLICTFGLGGVPIGISDVLLTSDSDDQDSDITLPTIGNILRVRQYLDHSVTGLKRKVQPLAGGAFAWWAGDYVTCRKALQLIDQMISTGASAWHVQCLLWSFEMEREDCAIIVAVPNQDGWAIAKGGTREHKQHPFSHLIIAGTGCEMALEVIQALNLGENPADPHLLSLTAMSYGMHTMAFLLQQELTSGATIKKRFGAAYEVVGLSNSGLVSPKVLHVHLEAKVGLNGLVLSVYPVITHTMTDRDCLIVRTIELSYDSTGCNLKEYRCSVIPPLFEQNDIPDKDDYKESCFTYEWVCITANLLIGSTNMLMAKAIYESSGLKTITLEKTSEGYLLGCHQARLKMIADWMKGKAASEGYEI